MKRILKIFSVLFFVVILSGCNKNLEKVSYTDYNEYFNSKDGYTILDKSSDYDLSVIRYLEAGNGNVQVFFTEYQKTEDAKKEIEDLYKNQKNYKFKEKDNYIVDMTLVVPDERQAIMLCDNWKKKSSEIYRHLMKELM